MVAAVVVVKNRLTRRAPPPNLLTKSSSDAHLCRFVCRDSAAQRGGGCALTHPSRHHVDCHDSRLRPGTHASPRCSSVFLPKCLRDEAQHRQDTVCSTSGGEDCKTISILALGTFKPENPGIPKVRFSDSLCRSSGACPPMVLLNRKAHTLFSGCGCPSSGKQHASFPGSACPFCCFPPPSRLAHYHSGSCPEMYPRPW